MWSGEENVGQSDTGQAGVPVDELSSGDAGARQHGLPKKNREDDQVTVKGEEDHLLSSREGLRLR